METEIQGLGEARKKVENSPYQVELSSETKYFWCTCGLSINQPFCDGSHKGSGKKSCPFEVDKPKTVWLCGCKQTQTPPYCDGSHTKLAYK